MMNVETNGTMDYGELGLEKNSADTPYRYEPCSINVLHACISELGHIDQYFFIDIGSGKGRALFGAARHPFKKVIGIELSSSAFNIARSNLQTVKKSLLACHDVELVRMNALDFEFPMQNLVLWMFNPFNADAMRKMIDKISTQFANSACYIHLFYLSPLHYEAVLENGFFCQKQIKKYRISSQNFDVAFFERKGFCAGKCDCLMS
jgi:predicted RNA methylase